MGSRLLILFSLFFLPSRSCWCRWRRSKASRTLSLASLGKCPPLIILSHTRSATCSSVAASVSNIIVPLSSRLRSSNSECSESVATCGLDQRFPPSSTSSSNLTQRAVSFHSSSSPSCTSSSISEKSGWDSTSLSSTSSPRMNWTRCDGFMAAGNN